MANYLDCGITQIIDSSSQYHNDLLRKEKFEYFRYGSAITDTKIFFVLAKEGVIRKIYYDKLPAIKQMKDELK